MATKNLARTTIEGGRCGYYKMEVAASAAAERAATRSFLRRVARDEEDAEGLADPRRRPVRVCFADKLAPIERFLDTCCGRPWLKVRGELFGRFDIRTTPGRHILFDHILPQIEGDRRWQPRYAIDRHGILRRTVRQRYPKRIDSWWDDRRALAWLGDRRITRAGDRFMWWVPTKRIQRKFAGRIDVRWRATGLLSEADETYVRSLSAPTLEKLLARD